MHVAYAARSRPRYAAGAAFSHLPAPGIARGPLGRPAGQHRGQRQGCPARPDQRMASRPPHEALHRQDTGQTITPAPAATNATAAPITAEKTRLIDNQTPDSQEKAREDVRVIRREPLRNRALPGTIKREERPGEADPVIGGPAGNAAAMDARQAGRDQEGPVMATSSSPPPGTGQAEPVPVAILARTSTLALQDPVRVAEPADHLRPRLAARRLLRGRILLGRRIRRPGHRTTRARQLRSAHRRGLPRDGGLADLLAEAEAPAPPVRRRGGAKTSSGPPGTPTIRLKLERQLADQGIPLVCHRRAADIDRDQPDHHPCCAGPSRGVAE